MTDETFLRAAPVAEVRRRGRLNVEFDDDRIVLFDLDGTIVAYENRCPHQQLAMLHQGDIANGCVTCPMHGWTFDLRTGANVNGNGRLRPRPVRIVNDYVEVGGSRSPSSFGTW